jgi:hypothetical protein
MATPKRNDLMIRSLMAQYKSKNKQANSCTRQFPDCPEHPNGSDCKLCPFYKKTIINKKREEIEVKPNIQ